MSSNEEVAQKIDQYIAHFTKERWAHPDRKLDVLLGLKLAARIARGEAPERPKEMKTR